MYYREITPSMFLLTSLYLSIISSGVFIKVLIEILVYLPFLDKEKFNFVFKPLKILSI